MEDQACAPLSDRSASDRQGVRVEESFYSVPDQERFEGIVSEHTWIVENGRWVFDDDRLISGDDIVVAPTKPIWDK